MKTVAIIVLNWKTAELTINTINSLKKIEHKIFKYHIYLIENGSPDNSLTILKNKFSKDPLITIIPLSVNLGFAGGNNIGIQAALKRPYDYLLLINSDVIVDTQFLTQLLNSAAKHQDVGLIGPKIYFASGYEFHKDRYLREELGHVIWSIGSKMDWNNIYGSNLGIDEVDRGQYETFNSNLEFISACCILIIPEVIKYTGLMSSDYFMYYEDNDFCQRIRSAGFKIALDPSAKIWHLNSGSNEAGGGSLHDYFLTRNRLIFGFKYAKLRTKFALFRDTIRTIFTGTPWQKRGVIDFYLRKFGKGSWQ